MQLTLHLPALFSPPAPLASPLPATPVLDRLLARADARHEARAGAGWLDTRLGIDGARAPARWLARRDEVPMLDEDILFAEPVRLVADHRTVHLSPGRTLGLNPIEAASIAMSLDRHFAHLGLRFTASEAARVYAHLPRAERPATTPVETAARIPLLDAQPKSSGRIKWHAVQGEIEMLLHGHPVNVLREKYGRPTVTGIWFWGEGDEPRGTASRPVPFELIATDAQWLQQLARERGIATRAPDWAGAKGARVLVHLEAFERAACDGDAERWRQTLSQLESGWAAQIAAGFATGNVQSACVIAETPAASDQFVLDAHAWRWRFWRRTRAFASLVEHGAHPQT